MPIKKQNLKRVYYTHWANKGIKTKITMMMILVMEKAQMIVVLISGLLI